MPPEVAKAIERINAGNPLPGDREVAQDWLFGGASAPVQQMQGSPPLQGTPNQQATDAVTSAQPGPGSPSDQPQQQPQEGGPIGDMLKLIGRLNQRIRELEGQGGEQQAPAQEKGADMSFTLEETGQAEPKAPDEPGLGGVPEEVRQTLLRAGVPEQVANDRAFQVARMESEGVVFDAKTFVRAIERGASPRDAFFEGVGSADRFGDRKRAEDAIMENLGFIEEADVTVPEQGAFAKRERQRARGTQNAERTEQLKNRVEARRAMRQGAPISSGPSGPRSEGRAAPEPPSDLETFRKKLIRALSSDTTEQ